MNYCWKFDEVYSRILIVNLKIRTKRAINNEGNKVDVVIVVNLPLHHQRKKAPPSGVPFSSLLMFSLSKTPDFRIHRNPRICYKHRAPALGSAPLREGQKI